MLFSSIDFAIFLPVVFALYWFVFKRLQQQNLLIVTASYFFYGWWDWRFLSLILFSTIVDYIVGLKLSSEENKTNRLILLWTSIMVNLGFLGFFKYYNFFTENFAQAFTLLGQSIEPSRLNIILPVGISFYTFQTLSYSIDVYKRKLEPTRDYVAFAAFVSFFPQLVAGPIERATNLLPQFYDKRNFDYHKAVDGLRQILWGLFKKIVIADTCAKHVNEIFSNYPGYSGSTLFLGGFLFAFQIYGDFSGYSDIAIGTSRLFGFNLKRNFAFPYFSRDIAEFWRRWHISLSTWFRDYLYIPLGGSKGGTWMKVRNTFIIFIVSGFWHGANWTFITWGALNAVYFLPLLLRNKNRMHIESVASGRNLPNLNEVWRMALTFFLTIIAWIFFRSESVTDAFSYLSHMFTPSLFSIPEVLPIKLALIIPVFVLLEWLGREGEYAIEKLGLKLNRPARWSLYLTMVIGILYFAGKPQDFIYFQF